MGKQGFGQESEVINIFYATQALKLDEGLFSIQSSFSHRPKIIILIKEYPNDYWGSGSS